MNFQFVFLIAATNLLIVNQVMDKTASDHAGRMID